MILLKLLLPALFLSSACAADVDEQVAFNDELADTGPIDVQFKSDPILSNTKDYEDLNGVALEVAVLEEPLQLWTHDIAVFEPEHFAYFATDSEGWRLSVLQGLKSELGGLLLTPTQMTECRSVASGEEVTCPTQGQTGRFISVLIDSQKAVAHVHAIAGDWDIKGDILIDGTTMHNFYHIVPQPIQLQKQEQSIKLTACNYQDCWK